MYVIAVKSCITYLLKIKVKMKFIVGFVLFGLVTSGKLDFSLIVKDLKEFFFMLKMEICMFSILIEFIQRF